MIELTGIKVQAECENNSVNAYESINDSINNIISELPKVTDDNVLIKDAISLLCQFKLAISKDSTELIDHNAIIKDIIMQTVLNKLRVTMDEVKSKHRKKNIVTARHLIAYGMKKYLKGYYSLKEIGKLIGGRDHATVLHSSQTIADSLSTIKLTGTYSTVWDEIIYDTINTIDNKISEMRKASLVKLNQLNIKA